MISVYILHQANIELVFSFSFLWKNPWCQIIKRIFSYSQPNLWRYEPYQQQHTLYRKGDCGKSRRTLLPEKFLPAIAKTEYSSRITIFSYLKYRKAPPIPILEETMFSSLTTGIKMFLINISFFSWSVGSFQSKFMLDFVYVPNITR